MNKNSTHLLQNYTKRSILSRAKDGLIIAVREQCRVAWGEDPRQQEQRSFIDEAHAISFIRKLADIDQTARKGLFCKDCGEVPRDSVMCMGNEDQVHRIEFGTVARIEEVDGEPRIRSVM